MYRMSSRIASYLEKHSLDPSRPTKKKKKKKIIISDASIYPVKLLGTDLHCALEAWERSITVT